MSPMPSRLSNKKVLLIGGTSGIGFAVASLVLDQGATVIISSSSQSNVSHAISRLTTLLPDAADRIFGQTWDITDESNIDTNTISLLDFAYQAHRPGPIHHIVFTAGNRQRIPPFSDASLEAVRKLSAVRYIGPVFLFKHAPDYMAPGPEASITLTTNAGEEKPMKSWGLSLAANSIFGLVRGMAVDLAPRRVNLVKLGFVQTELLQALAGAGTQDEEEKKRRFAELVKRKGEETLTGRVGDPESVAEAYAYLMKDWNVTGQSVTTDGGYTLT